MKSCIRMDGRDNVATVLEKVSAGERLQILDQQKNHVGELTALEDIPFAHKVCIRPIGEREYVIKFGVVIGRCIKAVGVGGYVHVHNVISIKGSEEVRGKERR